MNLTGDACFTRSGLEMILAYTFRLRLMCSYRYWRVLRTLDRQFHRRWDRNDHSRDTGNGNGRLLPRHHRGKQPSMQLGPL